MTYIFEIVGQNRRLFYGSLLIAATHFGGAVACICAYLSSNKFQHIFMLAGLIGLLSLKGRAMLTETYVQKESKNMIFSKYNSSNSTVCSYLNVIAASSCLIFIFFTIMIYCNKIIIQKFAIDMQTVFFINLVLHLVWVIFLPIVGIISDRYSIPIVRIMRTGSIATICIGIPALIFGYHSENIKIFMIAQLLVTLTHIIFCMPTPKMICSFLQSMYVIRMYHLAMA